LRGGEATARRVADFAFTFAFGFAFTCIGGLAFVLVAGLAGATKDDGAGSRNVRAISSASGLS
jgi:hypothetical protein